MQMNFWYTKAKSYKTQEKSKYSIEIIFFQIPIGDGQKTKVGSAYNNYINNVLCICKLILIFHPAPQKI